MGDELLSTIAEVAVTLAGFSGVILRWETGQVASSPQK
jgi:hypothetical protein